MWITLAAALAVGVYLVSVGGWPIVIIGLVSLMLAIGYTAGPVPLAYVGLGDLFVFVFFGLVAVGGTYWVQGHSLPPEVLWAGVGPGALATAILVVNNLRDRPGDEATGKRTLAVRFGDGFSRAEYLFLLFLAWHVPPLGVAVFGWPWLTLLALLTFIAAIPSIRLVWSDGERVALNPALGGTARVLAFYAGLLALGLALG